MKANVRKLISVAVPMVFSLAITASIITPPAVNAALSSFNMDGPPMIETIVPNLEGWTLDFDSGNLYWSDFSPLSRIARVNPDDEVVSNVVSLTSTERPRDSVAVNGQVYFAKLTVPFSGGVTHSISRVDVDGTNMIDLVTNLGLDAVSPSGVAVSDKHIYWSMATNDDRAGTIQRADLNGNNVETLVTDLNDPTSIVLDLVNDYMYWTDTRTLKIQRARLDGGTVEDVVSEDPGRKQDLALDIDNNKLYWTNGA